jgi:pyruvate dehydrogenase E2 component (dihydrolipoamide acetyltransferase)
LDAARDIVSPASAPDAAGAASAVPDTGKGDTEVVQLNRTQKTIARRMTDAAQVPTFTLSMDVDVTDLLSVRDRMRASHDPLPSVNDFVVRAAALTLRDHPRVNGSYADDAWHLHSRVNVGVAVAAGDVLLVPVVHDADTLCVTDIAKTSRQLAAAARDGNITPPQLSAGTFTVSNLGMMGVTSFTAIITPGQAAILAVGASVDRVALADGVPVVRKVMTVTLTCDHRILNGADGAAFLAALRDRLQQPYGLLR